MVFINSFCCHISYKIKIYFLKYQSSGYANSDDVLPVYIGDDRTDEDAFKVYIIYIVIYTHNFYQEKIFSKY